MPDGVDKCVLHVFVSLAGQYRLPDGLELVSAVFWVHTDPQLLFKRKLTIEVQHCAKMTSCTKLTFVRAVSTQDSLPYTFKRLEGCGSFSGQSSYGCLSVNGFSGYGIGAEGNVERLYIASLYYLKANPRRIDIYFAITWDEKAHITVNLYILCIGIQSVSSALIIYTGNKGLL